MSLVKELRAASKLFKPEAHAAADYIEQLEKQRDQLLADLATAEQDSRQKQARIDRLERERDELLAAIENLHKVKGRYHTEQAFQTLMATYDRVKGGEV